MKTNELCQPRVLVSAASEHGSTTEIARVIGDRLADKGLAVDIVPPGVVDSIEDYDAVILGSAVYVGRWLVPARDFVPRFLDALAGRPVWLFSSGPVGDPSRKLVRSMDQDPVDVANIRQVIRVRGHRMFAGKLDPKLLSVPQRVAVMVFRGTRGDFRNWTEVTQWADSIAEALVTESHGITGLQEPAGPGGARSAGRMDAAAGDAGRDDPHEQLAVTVWPGFDACLLC
jgi:menaquinone-dependent protoporphyrinogen oxidase